MFKKIVKINILACLTFSTAVSFACHNGPTSCVGLPQEYCGSVSIEPSSEKVCYNGHYEDCSWNKTTSSCTNSDATTQTCTPC